jgi:hypothetical protein
MADYRTSPVGNNIFLSFDLPLITMKRVTLLFPDTRSLWAFAQTLQSNYIQINSTERKMTCHCSEVEISKALMQFNAEIVDEIEERNQKV